MHRRNSIRPTVLIGLKGIDFGSDPGAKVDFGLNFIPLAGG
jgi:hypothetical protein